MFNKLNIGIRLTNRAKENIADAFNVDNLSEIIKDEYYNCYLQNAGETNEYKTKIRILLASDTENEYNRDFINEQNDKTISIEGFNSDNRYFCIISIRKISKNIAKENNRSILRKIKFYEEDDIKMSSIPDELIKEISEIPDVKRIHNNIDRRIRDWEEFFTIIENNAKESEIAIKYEGFKQREDLTKCVFKFKRFSESESAKLKVCKNEKVMLITKGKVEDVESVCIGTIESIDLKNYTIEVLLELELQEIALEGKLNFEKGGTLSISKIGDLAQARNLKNGLKNLKNGKAKNPNMDRFLFDAKLVSNNYKSIVLKQEELLAKNLNENQKSAVEGVLNSEDLFLIQGPPGTGKTTVISEICYQNAIRGMKTLVASQSNLAVDNALSRIVNDTNIRALRKGNIVRVEDYGIKYTEENILDTWMSDTTRICKSKISDHEIMLEALYELENKAKKILSLNKKRIEIDAEISSIYRHIIELYEEQKKLEENVEIEQLKIEQLNRSTEKLKVLLYRFKKVNKLLIKLKEKYGIFNEKAIGITLSNNIDDNLIKIFENKVKNLYEFKDTLDGCTTSFFKSWQRTVIKNIIITDKYGKHLEELIELNNKKEEIIRKNFYNFDSKALKDALLNINEKINANSLRKADLEKEMKLIVDEIERFYYKFNKVFNMDCTIENACDDECTSFYLNKIDIKKMELLSNIEISKELINRIEDKNYGNKESLKELYINNANVIGITCVQSGNRDFTENYPDFDVVIIDEVSKATPPELILPMLKGKKTILVGDHKQLPPMIGTKTFEELKYKKIYDEQGSESDIEHIKRSLFEELFFDIDYRNKVMLNIQYRMHKSIMNTINQFYKDDNEQGLLCGLDNKGDSNNHNIETSYLNNENKIIWIDMPYNENYFDSKTYKNSHYNLEEIKVIEKILSDINESVKDSNIKKEVAVITFYSEQARRMQKTFLSTAKYKNLKLRIGTVDRFQGMESEIVIVSFVRNNYQNNVGFAEDPKRVNVALSRAKSLLIVVGCSELFCIKNKKYKVREIYKNVFDCIKLCDGIRDVSRIFN